MPSSFYRLVFLLLCAVLPLSSASGQATKKVLFIGNSYTYFNNMSSMVASFATANGDQLIYNSSTGGGFSFYSHSSFNGTLNKIESDDWDAVVLQEQSLNPLLNNWIFEAYAKVLGQDLVRKNDFCRQIMFLMTWGREDPLVQCPGCGYDDYFEMQDSLEVAYQRVADDVRADLAPVGIAWRKVLETDSSFDLHVDDGSHPSLQGSYLTAAVLYSALFETNPVELEFDAGLDSAKARFLRIKAYEAVSLYDSLGWLNYEKATSPRDIEMLTMEHGSLSGLCALPDSAIVEAETHVRGVWDSEVNAGFAFTQSNGDTLSSLLIALELDSTCLDTVVKWSSMVQIESYGEFEALFGFGDSVDAYALDNSLSTSFSKQYHPISLAAPLSRYREDFENEKIAPLSGWSVNGIGGLQATAQGFGVEPSDGIHTAYVGQFTGDQESSLVSMCIWLDHRHDYEISMDLSASSLFPDSLGARIGLHVHPDMSDTVWGDDLDRTSFSLPVRDSVELKVVESGYYYLSISSSGFYEAAIAAIDSLVVRSLSDSCDVTEHVVIVDTVCGSDSYIWDGDSIWDGQVGDTLLSSWGCDSIRNLTLRRETNPVASIDLYTDSLVADGGDSYLWFNDQNLIIQNNGRAVTPDSSGWYRVVVRDGKCTDTSQFHYWDALVPVWETELGKEWLYGLDVLSISHTEMEVFIKDHAQGSFSTLEGKELDLRHYRGFVIYLPDSQGKKAISMRLFYLY